MNKNKEIFEKIYEKPGAVWTRTEPPQELVELIESGKTKPGKIIDIGCGEGFYSIYLASKGFEVTGIDLSEKAIKYAKENAVRRGVNVRFLVMDIADLEQLKEKFDFVLEWGVMHHIMPLQRQKYVEDVAKLLNKGGKYLSICFNEQSPEFGGSGKRYRTSPLGTKIYYSSQDELRKLFEPYFRIIKTKIIKIFGGGKESKEHIGNYFLMEKKMKEGENNESKREEEECPLCKISEETMERLEKKEQASKEPEIKIKKKTSWKIKVLILVLIIFIIGLVGVAFYKFFLTSSLEEENPIQEQSKAKDKSSILDIIFPKSLEVGDLAPDFVSEDVFGNKTALSDFRNKKPVVLIFWATWCGFCAAELPDLKDFTTKYQNKIKVIAISSGESKKTIKNYIQEKEINFLMLLDEDREIWNQYLVRGTPTHFLIDTERKIVSLRPGLASKENLETMLTMLKEL